MNPPPFTSKPFSLHPPPHPSSTPNPNPPPSPPTSLQPNRKPPVTTPHANHKFHRHKFSLRHRLFIIHESPSSSSPTIYHQNHSSSPPLFPSKAAPKQPNSFSALPDLVRLDLSSNQLNGSIPKFISEMKSIKYLNLDNNNLNGVVPPKTISAQPLVVAGSEETLEKKPKDGPKRCSNCNKRFDLTRFICLCGNLFYVVHRYSDKQDCPFDYRTTGRDAIAKANPVAKAEKLDRIKNLVS
ncbi:hypothetical protein KIW84_060060 [Lathyrus oleraceus]|uniref:AN1-type domain-containing protein n=1 Tax=Pisum sativum TaxID=3888 RepID=A0A9D4VZT7_PEA|nr:hypothetical protein KIW84_060060 [Pisum sativum]